LWIQPWELGGPAAATHATVLLQLLLLLLAIVIVAIAKSEKIELEEEVLVQVIVVIILDEVVIEEEEGGHHQCQAHLQDAVLIMMLAHYLLQDILPDLHRPCPRHGVDPMDRRPFVKAVRHPGDLLRHFGMIDAEEAAVAEAAIGDHRPHKMIEIVATEGHRQGIAAGDGNSQTTYRGRSRNSLVYSGHYKLHYALDTVKKEVRLCGQ
jgi:hypothetical protein